MKLSLLLSLSQKHMTQLFSNTKLEGTLWHIFLCVTIVLMHHSFRIRKYDPNANVYAPLEIQHRGLVGAIIVSCYKPFRKWYSHFFTF